MTDTQLGQFLAGAGPKPYRDLVEYRMKEQSPSELQAAVLGETLLLREPLRSLVEAYIDRVNDRLAYDKKFWDTATCKEAFTVIIGVAIEHFLLTDVIGSVEDALLPKNHELAFQLFQIATLSFAYSASLEPKQREFMGIAGRRVSGVLSQMLLTGIVGLVLFGVYFLLGDRAAEYLGTALFLGVLAFILWRFLAMRKEPRR